MLILLSLWLSLAQSNKNELSGTWINQDPITMGITHIVIGDQGDHLVAHAWGACVPTDCDWGATDVRFTDGSATSIFDMGFIAERMYFVRLPNDKLLAVSASEFKDGSNRHEPEHAEIFVREVESQDAASVSAKNLLKAVAETYRNLSAGEFKSEEISDNGTRVSTFRVKTAFSQPNKWRVETSGSGEESTSISDGHTTWTYFPESNEYETYPAGKRQPGVAQYGLLDDLVGSSKITGSEHLGDLSCTILTITRPKQTRQLWIDPKTNFVHKDQITTVSPTTGAVLRSVTTTFSLARALTNVDENAFLFDPEKAQAKSRTAAQREALVKSVGKPAPDFSLLDSEGKQFKLSELKGKTVLLDFWATWCVPCRAEMPTIELLHREFKDKGLIVLGVDDEEAQIQNEFLKKFDFSFASLVEPKKQASNLYNVGGIPTTVVIDREGMIRAFDQDTASYESLRESLHAVGVH
jgi:peroxiredoxin/outer membrane lipoprotein-sorting protein